MESDLSSLHFSIFLIDLISNQNDGNVIANSSQIFIPLGHILIGDSGCHIKHDDGSIGSNVVPFSESSQFLLASSIPNAKLDRAVISIEGD